MNEGLAEAVGAVEIGPLRHSLGFLLRLAQIERFERFYTAFEGAGLTPGAFTALIVVSANPGIRQGHLGKSLRIKPANLTKMIRNFEDRGLISRSIPDDDRRAVELVLTEAGKRFLADHLTEFKKHESEIPGRLTAGEHRELIRLLCKMVDMEETK